VKLVSEGASHRGTQYHGRSVQTMVARNDVIDEYGLKWGESSEVLTRTATWPPVFQFHTMTVAFPLIVSVPCDQGCSCTTAARWSQQTTGVSADTPDVLVPISKTPE